MKRIYEDFSLIGLGCMFGLGVGHFASDELYAVVLVLSGIPTMVFAAKSLSMLRRKA